MAKMKEIAEGLAILMKYDADGSVCAEHDILAAAPDVRKDQVSAEDRAKLEELGWHWSSEADSWAAFT